MIFRQIFGAQKFGGEFGYRLRLGALVNCLTGDPFRLRADLVITWEAGTLGSGRTATYDVGTRSVLTYFLVNCILCTMPPSRHIIVRSIVKSRTVHA